MFLAKDSDVSAADPNDILKNMKVSSYKQTGIRKRFSFDLCVRGHYCLSLPMQDMDDMDADLFASKKKPSSAPPQTKPFGNEGPKKDFAALENNVKPEGAGNFVHNVFA